MILIEIPHFQCYKCYSIIDVTLIKGNDLDSTNIQFKHSYIDGYTCEDENKILGTKPITSYLVSELHDS